MFKYLFLYTLQLPQAPFSSRWPANFSQWHTLLTRRKLFQLKYPTYTSEEKQQRRYELSSNLSTDTTEGIFLSRSFKALKIGINKQTKKHLLYFIQTLGGICQLVRLMTILGTCAVICDIKFQACILQYLPSAQNIPLQSCAQSPGTQVNSRAL